ncbi:unnamed protein product, partial [Rangifer tarandus platyrhynchus]
GGRYVPGSSSGSSNTLLAADPFTDNRGIHHPRHSMSAVTGEMLLIMSREGAM